VPGEVSSVGGFFLSLFLGERIHGKEGEESGQEDREEGQEGQEEVTRFFRPAGRDLLVRANRASGSEQTDGGALLSAAPPRTCAQQRSLADSGKRKRRRGTTRRRFFFGPHSGRRVTARVDLELAFRRAYRGQWAPVPVGESRPA